MFALFSFCLNIILVYLVDSKYSFYLPLTRFWQLAVGSLLAYYDIVATSSYHQPKKQKPPTYSQVTQTESAGEEKMTENSKEGEIIASFGFLLIGLSYGLLTETSVFPGFWALLPTIGAACIIYAGQSSLLNKYILGSKILVFIGKISYPLYLWHWPLLVFSRELFPIDNTIISNPAVWLAFSFIASCFTSFVIENKIRYQNHKLIPIVLFAGNIIIGAISLGMLQPAISLGMLQPASYGNALFSNTTFCLHHNTTYNTTSRLNSSKGPLIYQPTVEKVKAAVPDFGWAFPDFNWERDYPQFIQGGTVPNAHMILNDGKDKKVVIWGDSHAEMIKSRFIALLAARGTDSFPTLVAFCRSGAPTIRCPNCPSKNAAYFQQDLDEILRIKPAAILIVNFYAKYFTDFYRDGRQSNNCFLFKSEAEIVEKSNTLLDLMVQDIKAIQSVGTKVFITTQNVYGNQYNPKNMYNYHGLDQTQLAPFKLSEFRSKNKNLFDILESHFAALGVTVIDLSDDLCYNDICEVIDRYGRPIMVDEYGHFRSCYSAVYSSVLDQVVDV